MSEALPSRLIIDLPNWLGDQMMAMPAVRRLVDANAAGRTTIHTRPPMQRLLELLFPGARIVASAHKASPIKGALRLCREDGRFEVGITLRHAWRAKILLRLAARRTLGSGSEGARLLIDRHFPVDRRRHQVFDADPLLDALGLAGVDAGWRPRLPESLRDDGRRLLEAAGLWGRRLVGLAPAAAWGRSKRWPASGYGALAGALAERGLQPVLVVGPGEERLAAEVREFAGGAAEVAGPGVDVAGLAGLLSHLELLVCNDSGPMHLATAVGTPVVALFGPTDPARTGPLGNGHQALWRGLDCAPCGEASCPLDHNDCLHGLEVNEVREAVERVLG